ncbi:MAG: methyltransferase domain-containing protein [Gemmatimonadetes bacterium]|nr:methyltransferase domain-containing protein [Gemmatimonadota bacterium]
MTQQQHIWMCPVCQQALRLVDRQFLCAEGHSFDVAREGYVNLVLAHQRSSSQAGDPPDSLRQRRLFLEAGDYEALANRVIEMVTSHLEGHVLDVGCGEGYLLRRLQTAAVAQGGNDAQPTRVAQFHGVDISREGVRMGARMSEAIAFAVGNAYRLPVQADSVRLCLVMMAPREGAEIQRVLAADGILLCVTPGEGHLANFRKLVYNDARPHTPVEVPAGFHVVSEEPVSFPLNLTSKESVSQLLEMTPYKWHMDPETYQRVRGVESLTDTADFTVQLLRRA